MIVIRRHSTIVLGRIGEQSGRIPTKELVYFKSIFWLPFCTFGLTKGEIISLIIVNHHQHQHRPIKRRKLSSTFITRVHPSTRMIGDQRFIYVGHMHIHYIGESILNIILLSVHSCVLRSYYHRLYYHRSLLIEKMRTRSTILAVVLIGVLRVITGVIITQ